MGATDRLTLLLEAKEIGLQDVLRMEQAINRVVDQAQKARAAGDGVAQASGRLQQSTQQFGQNVGNFIRDPLGTAANAAQGFISTLGPMGLALGAAGAAAIASGTALVGFIKSTGDAAEKILNLSITTGLSAREVQLFQGALELSGASIEDLEKASVKLNQQLADTGQNGQKARKALADIGVSIYDTNGNLKEAGPLLADLSRGLASIGDRAERDRVGVDLLGKAYRALIPAFSELGSNVEILRRDGIGIDEKTLQRADALGDKLSRLGGILSQNVTLAKSFAAAFAEPVIDRILAIGGGRPQQGGTIGNPDPPFVAPPSIFTLSTPSTRAQASLRGALTGGASIESQRQQLGDLRNQIDSARLKIGELANTPGITEEAASREISSLRSLESQYKRLESQIDAAEKAKREFERLDALGTFRLTDQFFRFGQNRVLFDPETGKPTGETAASAVPSLRRAGERSRPLALDPFAFRVKDRDGAVLLSTEANIQSTNGGSEEAALQRSLAFIRALKDAEDQRRRTQIDAIQQQVQFESERLKLIAGPGGELAAVRAIAQLRLDSIERELAITGDLRAAEQQRLETRRNLQLEELRYARERDDRNRQTGGQVFDALLAGGSGIRGFVGGLGLGFGRTAFGNLFAEIARGTTGALQLPGQTGPDGRPNLFGRVLAGTPFGLDPQKVALDANTIATNQNTAALLGVRGGGTASSLLGSLPSTLFGGSGSNPFIFSATGGTRSAGIIGADGLPLGIVGQGAGLGNPALGLTTMQKIGGIAAIAGGGLLVKSGIQQGGVGGALDAGAGVAGSLAALLPLIGASGPAAPILAGVAIGATLIKSFLPDPRKQRARAIEQLVNSSAVDFGEVAAIDTDFSRGGTLASTKGGIVVIQNINAADAQSFYDRRRDIADAVAGAIAEGDTRINQEISRAVDLGQV